MITPGVRAALLVGTAAVCIASGAPGWQRDLGGNSAGVGVAGAVDTAGDIVAAGVLGADHELGVVKLAGKDGRRRWKVLVPAAGPDYDVAADVAVDGAGNVIAAGGLGAMEPGGLALQFAVLKLAGTNGTELWRRTINGNAFGHDGANQVEVDAAGDVIAAGWIVNSGPHDDILVVKLAAATGAELWRAEIAGDATGSYVRSLVLDGAGDVIAAGSRGTVAGGWDFFVVKLSGTSGAELWRMESDGSAHAQDLANAVAVDASGDVVAAGYETDTASGQDFIVVKLAGASGTELWRTAIDGSDTGTESAYAVTIDGAGDVVATGSTSNVATATDLLVVKLAGASGTEVWRAERHVGAFEYAGAAKVDPADNVVIGASMGGAFRVMKLAAASGAELWQHEIAHQSTTPGAATALALDAAANTFAVGVGGHPRRGNFTVVKLSEKVSGRKLDVKTLRTGLGEVRFKAQSKDRGFFVPADGTPGAPTVNGAQLALINPVSGEIEVIALPSTGWESISLPGKPSRYQYRDKSGALGTCKKVEIRTDKGLSAYCQGATFTLNEAAQGSLAVRLVIGNDGAAYCALFGGVIGRDQPGSFKAKDAPAAAACPGP